MWELRHPAKHEVVLLNCKIPGHDNFRWDELVMPVYKFIFCYLFIPLKKMSFSVKKIKIAVLLTYENWNGPYTQRCCSVHVGICLHGEGTPSHYCSMVRSSPWCLKSPQAGTFYLKLETERHRISRNISHVVDRLSQHLPFLQSLPFLSVACLSLRDDVPTSHHKNWSRFPCVVVKCEQKRKYHGRILKVCLLSSEVLPSVPASAESALKMKTTDI